MSLISNWEYYQDEELKKEVLKYYLEVREIVPAIVNNLSHRESHLSLAHAIDRFLEEITSTEEGLEVLMRHVNIG